MKELGFVFSAFGGTTFLLTGQMNSSSAKKNLNVTRAFALVFAGRAASLLYFGPLATMGA